jgi:NTP pyrophosphatase (non-canonical NTP hydrolase)
MMYGFGKGAEVVVGLGMTHPPGSVPGSSATPAQGGGSLSFRGFQRLIRERYYATDAARGTPGTFLWLMEEVGELATALQNNGAGKTPTPEERDNLSEEFADVIAWLTTLANINGVDLEVALQKYTVKGVEGVKE